MDNLKHTPGPWTASEGYPSSVWHVDMPGRAFAITVSIDDDEERDVPDEETEANARLIAAAPETKRQRDELLEALQLLADAYDAVGPSCQAARLARQAINEATKEEAMTDEAFARYVSDEGGDGS
mgnify:CR=1 FL=1